MNVYYFEFSDGYVVFYIGENWTKVDQEKVFGLCVEHGQIVYSSSYYDANVIIGSEIKV